MNTPDILHAHSEAVGEALVAYVLNADVAGLPALMTGQAQLSPAQQTVVGVLGQILDAPLPYETQEVNRSQILRTILVQADDNGVCLAQHLHMQAGATIPGVEGEGPIQEALIQLAIDAYPAFLIPRDDELMSVQIGASINVTRILFRHPQQQIFQDAVRADPIFASLFDSTIPEAGVMLYRNTGTGGGVQLIMFAENILSNAWWRVEHDSPTIESFIDTSLSQLQLIRELIDGKTAPSVATFAFTGVLLPDGVQKVNFGNASLEATTAADRELAPQSLKQQLTTTDPTGAAIVVNYDGDVVLRQEFPLKVRIGKPFALGTNQAWPGDVYPPKGLDRNAERLRLSLTLAVQREYPVMILPTWRHLADPFAVGKMATAWSDPRTAVGIQPTKLTEAELTSWVEWYKILCSPQTDRINVAITRILKGLSERKEPPDMLIDAVIAWENLFGTPDGEPTLRITASLALLLESDPLKRKTLRSRLAKIYKLRSDVVHGNRALEAKEYPMCREALDVAIQALRVLAKERTDVLDLPDGATRSLHLILGAQEPIESEDPDPTSGPAVADEVDGAN